MKAMRSLLATCLIYPALSISSPNPLLASDKAEPVKRDIFGSVSYEKALEAARKDKKTLFVLLTMYGCRWSERRTRCA